MNFGSCGEGEAGIGAGSNMGYANHSSQIPDRFRFLPAPASGKDEQVLTINAYHIIKLKSLIQVKINKIRFFGKGHICPMGHHLPTPHTNKIGASCHEVK